MGIRFFIDENIGRNIADGLATLEYNVEHLLDTFDPGTKDVEWLEYVGKNKLALITKDKNIKRRPNEKALLIKYKVVAFFLGGRQQSARAIVKQLVNAWSNMEEKAKHQFKTNTAGAFRVSPSGGKIERIQL